MIRQTKTENGLVRGIEAADPRITVFRGVPFAAPPTGKNRWRTPQPCPDWEGVRECVHFAPISVQNTPGIGDSLYNREWHVDPEVPMDEDCLYLNIWTGAMSVDERRPVLVWYFGGGYQCGYTREMEFDGERLARKGIVVVSVNYRVNVFGFLAHPQLTKEQSDAPSNFGSLDQKAGLEWVVRNIANFGGNPAAITIAGQSAGGASVMSQLACAENEDKIARAVVMSGMIGNPYEEERFGKPTPLAEAEQLGEEFFDFLGVNSLEEARALDAFYIRDRYSEFAINHSCMFTVLDGAFCKEDPYEKLVAGNSIAVPLMAGNTSDEFPNYIKAQDREQFYQKTREFFGEKADEFLAFEENQKETTEGFAPVSGIEYSVKHAFLKRAEKAEKEAAKDTGKSIGADTSADKKYTSYYYRFDADIPGWDKAGTFHSCDLWFFFETLAKCWRPFDGHHYDLARQISSYFVNFIKNGDPNGRDSNGNELPQWNPYTAADHYEMSFTKNGAAGGDTEHARMRFLLEHVE